MKYFNIFVLVVFFATPAYAFSQHRHHWHWNPVIITAPPPQPPQPPKTPPPAPIPPPTIPTSSLQLGAFNGQFGTIQAYFDGWKDAPSCAPAGQTTFLYWENYGVSLDSIINGSQDAVIINFGNRVCPNTIIAPFHEMDLSESPWGGYASGNTPAKLIAAYKHIHDIIGSKVQYAWVVNNSDGPDVTGNRPANYYPGDAYVDIIGVDGFQWTNETFMQAIAPNYSVVKSYGKPVWITSFGVQKNQGPWLTDAIAQAKANNIGALIYFDYNDGGNFQLTSAGLAAYHVL